MNSLSRDYYPFVPKWREERDLLVKEVHGDSVEKTEPQLPSNKVSSRNKFITKKLVTPKQIDNQKFYDFLLACEGFNTISFSYETTHWKFDSENFEVSGKENNNMARKFNVYDSYAAELLTKIQDIKNSLFHFQQKVQFGRCIAILTDEINQFMTVDLKKHLNKIREKPDATKTIMQSIYLALNDPINSIDNFLSKVDASNSVGGHLLDLIKEERDSLAKCYQSVFHQILDRAYTRGMNFYMGILADWLNCSNLDNDMFFEFFIWDTAKRRYSNLVAQSDSSILGSDELVFLQSVKPSKFYSPIDFKTFKGRYLIIPELFPAEFGKELMNGIVRTGLYNHVLMSENRENFELESKNAFIGKIDFETLNHLSSVTKARQRHTGRIVLRHLCNQLEFSILIEKLPIYFCGIKNSVFDQFVELTENFDWSGISTHKNGKLNQLNRFYQRAIEMSPLVEDPLASMISLVFSVTGQIDSSHPPTANQAFYDRPLTDLEPEIHCKDSFRMAFPPTVFEPYRNLFRLRHTLRRALYLLKKKHFESRSELPQVESNALSLMIRFVQNYDSFVFGYKAPKLVDEYLELINAGIQKKTLDLDTFLKEQEHMIGQLHLAAFVSTIGDSFTNPMWTMLTRLMKYSRNQCDFMTTCVEVCRMVAKIKQYLRSKTVNGENLPELAGWLFGTNIRSMSGKKDGLRLCEELTKRFGTESSI